jgi:CRISPR/Cas system-associated exonuclease Cas4 (RecB family)
MPHSHSSIKDFQGCSRRFQQVRVLKRFKSVPTEATTYGKLVHESFEKFFSGEDLPAHLSTHAPLLGSIRDMEGERFCEQKLGLTRTFAPCDFFSPEVFFRGIPDLLIVNGTTAWVADWKTGKSSRYADTSQLELMAAMAMAHHPEVQTVKCMLFFLVAGDIIRSQYKRQELPEILSKWAGYAEQIDAMDASKLWPAKPSGLCKFCPVTEDVCEHR